MRSSLRPHLFLSRRRHFGEVPFRLGLDASLLAQTTQTLLANPHHRSLGLLLLLRARQARPHRPQESKAYALLNDTERPVRSDVMDAFRSYDVVPIPWSERESVKAELSN